MDVLGLFFAFLCAYMLCLGVVLFVVRFVCSLPLRSSWKTRTRSDWKLITCRHEGLVTRRLLSLSPGGDTEAPCRPDQHCPLMPRSHRIGRRNAKQDKARHCATTCGAPRCHRGAARRRVAQS